MLKGGGGDGLDGVLKHFVMLKRTDAGGEIPFYTKKIIYDNGRIYVRTRLNLIILNLTNSHKNRWSDTFSCTISPGKFRPSFVNKNEFATLHDKL